MNIAQTVELLEKVENIGDALNQSLNKTVERMNEAGFAGNYGEAVRSIKADLAKLDELADALRARVCASIVEKKYNS